MNVRTFAIAAAIVGGLTAALPLYAAGLRCPAELPSQDSRFEQVGSTPARPAPLEGMRLFDGTPGEEAKAAPAELAPDDEAEAGGSLNVAWRLSGSENLLMVCDYRKSATYYRANVQPAPRSCSMKRNARGTVAYCE